ncbi:LysR family transcriptional regulator [Actinomycetes bacterium KLBMP 9759]
MKLSQCAAFVAIADTGSFTKAAQVLGIGQSAVSHAIAGLEAELGVALMRRDRRGVELTGVGMRVLHHARATLLHAERMRDEASAPHDTIGSLRVGTSQSFSARLLPRLLTELRSRYPDLGITLREGVDARIARWLREQAIDVGIVQLPKPGMSTVPLLQDEVFAVVPRGHRLAGSSELTVAELAGEPIIMPFGGMEPILRTVFHGAGAEPAVAFRVHDIAALVAMVTEGLGVTVLPALALPAALPDLRVLPFSPPVVRHLAIGVRPAPTPAVEAFVESALSVARDAGWHRTAVQAVPSAGR